MNYAVLSAGLFIMVLAFLIFNSPANHPTGPIPSPSPQASINTSSLFSGYCEQVNPASAPTFHAPADNVLKVGDDDIDQSAGKIYTEPSHCGGNRNQIGQETTYRLIRRNVPMSVNDVRRNEYVWDDSSCHFRKAEFLDVNIPEVDSSKFTVFYPQISGEISLDRLIPSRTRNVDSTYMYFIDYGLVFLVHKNPDGSYTQLQGTTTQGSGEAFYLVDVYQDIDSGRPDLPPEALACDTSVTYPSVQPFANSQILEPNQQPQNQEQLQLKYFVFGQPTTSAPGGQIVNGWGVHCKPAVYLYPEKKQLVNVKVFPKGELSHTDPPYDPEKGWTVTANPTGILFNSHNSSPITHNYLYYESKLHDSEIKKPEKGWVVEGNNTQSMEKLFNTILPKLGLNKKEQKDFMDYWLNKLPKSPYYFVGLVDKNQRDYLERLEVTPNPQTSIRFSLYFEMLDQPKLVKEPVIQAPIRTGFTLVDWGGMVKLHPGTPFTCSQ